MAEAVHTIGELADDRSIKLSLVAVEHVEHRLNRAAEFLEHQMLILHLGGELASLEQPLTVPIEACRAGRGQILCGDRSIQPFIQEGQVGSGVGDGFRQNQVLHQIHLAVVLGVEDVVEAGQTVVFVATTITGDEVAIE